MSDQSYTSQNIQVLEGLDPVRKRPAMYIGSIDTAGLHESLREIIDNAVDESLGGFAHNVWIFLNKDGSATVFVLTGVSPYTYQWDVNAGSQTSSTATGLSAGSYLVIVTDSNGCTGTFTVNVNNTNGGVASITADQDVTCKGGSDGQITASISGGSAPYSYLWDNGDTAATTYSGLAAGAYTVQITDSAGCIVFETITINEPTSITATTNSTAATCNGGNGGNDGQATVSVSGGSAPYSYLCDNGDTTATTYSGLSLVANTVQITDAAGCFKS